MHSYESQDKAAGAIPAFVAEARHDAADPVIARFRAALKCVQASELERLYHRLPELDDQSRLAIRQFSDTLVAKMLYPPLESLDEESRSGPPHRLLDALQRLFRLDDSRWEGTVGQAENKSVSIAIDC